MKNLPRILAVLALLVSAPGCILTSGQLLVEFDLPNVRGLSTGLIEEDVDLNDDDDYREHKDKLKDIADFAVLGTVTNNLATDLSVEVYLTRDLTSGLTDTQVKTTGIKLWGPLRVPANGSVSVDWDGSAALFTTAGKEALIQEAKGDGAFTLWVVGTAGAYDFTITDGVLALVIDVGI